MAVKKKHLSRREAFDLEEKFSFDVGRPTGAAGAAQASSGQWAVRSDVQGYAAYLEEAKHQVSHSLSEIRQIEARVNAKALNIAKFTGVVRFARAGSSSDKVMVVSSGFPCIPGSSLKGIAQGSFVKATSVQPNRGKGYPLRLTKKK